MEKYSVSMCVYGGDNAEHFALALESILNNTLPPSEIVLVVDGPVKPELNAVIENYEKNKIFKIIRFPKNRGHGEARRVGLENTSNSLVAIMDADDIAAPDRFIKEVTAIVEHGADVVGGQITEFIDEPNNIVGKRTVPLNDTEIKEYLKSRCPMNLVTVMFKKEAVQKAGGFIDFYCEEDYFLWVRMTQQNMTFYNLPDVLVNVRVGSEMYNRRGGIKYFLSERKLQKYMLKNKIIGIFKYLKNVFIRFILQVLMPNKLRGFIFKKFAREN